VSHLASSVAVVRLHLEVLVQRYSAWLLVSGLLLVAVSVAAWSMVAPLRSDLAGMRVQLAQAEADLGSQPTTQALPRHDNELPAALPARSSAAAAIERLIDLAKEHQLDIAQAEYQMGGDRRDILESLQITLPLEGDYPSVRRWIEDVLRALPNASVDRIGFERSAVSTSRIVARVKLTLWFKNEPDAR